ncbi:NUDIX hydrolase [Methylobacterium sp. J-077]|uniref:NUDIX hydrolase n=1 Tax=Methylobacterium sp. J-077 TaxID=2836656 RepID=UPI001FBA6CB5|nr:NUDIX domain-containing protein [Methylobacterium sp. J-077]MCJ2126510.1 NUDIX domain-containing protein [Methylobacterium sp. J-077]
MPQPEPQQESEIPASPERTPSPARLRPRDAATLIVLDRRGKGGPKVLMGRRNPKLAFMPGQFVFPGGRIELGDRHMPVAGALPDYAEAALTRQVSRPPHHLGRALALAATRETYEETGLLLGTREHGAPETAPAGWEAFARHGILPDLEALHLVARAITPPKRVRRFDTRFFAVDRRLVAAEEPGRVSPEAEFTELAWVRLDAARKLDLPFITRAVLDDLEAQIAVDFAPYRMIPFHYERYGRRERVAL